MINTSDLAWKWERYLAELFYRLFSDLNFGPLSSVVELGPGYRYKTGMLLQNIGFQGVLYVVDSNPGAVKEIVKIYQTFLPGAKIIGIDKTLRDAIDVLPAKIDLFLSNHSVDDMIISTYADPESLQRVFDGTLKESDLLGQEWAKLIMDKDAIPVVQNMVFDDFIYFFEKIEFKHIIMSQYDSTEFLVNTDSAAITRDVFQRIKALISTDDRRLSELLMPPPKETDEYFKNPSFLTNIHIAKNWISGVYKKQ